MYSHAQIASKAERVIISISKNDGYNDVVLNTWPISKRLLVNINSSFIDKGFISIYNLSGILVTKKEIAIKNGDNNYTVDLDNVISDIYRINISGTSFNTDKRMVLE